MVLKTDEEVEDFIKCVEDSRQDWPDSFTVEFHIDNIIRTVKTVRELRDERDQLRAELARFKPAWKDAPANATHRAIDIDGDWLWFVGEPQESDENGWDYVGLDYDDSTDVVPVVFHRWRETLEERPCDET